MTLAEHRILSHHGAESNIDSTSHNRRTRVGDVLTWSLAVLACLWLGLCTGIGPLYWNKQGLAQFTWVNAAYTCLTFIATFAVIVVLVRVGEGRPILPVLRHRRCSRWRCGGAGGPAAAATTRRMAVRIRMARRTRRFVDRAARWLGRGLVAVTNRGWKIATLLVVGWLWVPVTLLSAFGADMRSQIREFSWAYNQWTGVRQPYIGFFSFVPMDTYPTAHYMWPVKPTYLTDQHNIALTVFYGSVASVSRYFTGSNDWGIVALSAAQCLFAAFCCASCAHRFLNMPWRTTQRPSPNVSRLIPGERYTPRDLPHPEYGMRRDREAGVVGKNARGVGTRIAPAGPFARLVTMVFFLVCPLVIFSTISLTKSPVFAFAFVWWFGACYELHMTRRTAAAPRVPAGFPRSTTTAALAISICLMMLSAKYAWYLLMAQVIFLLIADRHRWKTYLVVFALPVLVIHIAMSLLFSTGAVLSGDPIESRGIQLQQIARVAKLNPNGIPSSARTLLAPIFNLDQMADSYFQQDADPVKSSGIQAKKVSYRWRSVTKDDMSHFDAAWWQIVKANPRIATDAFLAKCFGYFDVADEPYVPMDYYLANDYVTHWSTWIKYRQPQWRVTVVRQTQSIGSIPVIGWLTHGNFYVILTLLLGAAEVIERRWNTLVWHLPLLLLMGVMITAPANNFERHMLPVAFVFCFMALTYWRESKPHAEERASSR